MGSDPEQGRLFVEEEEFAWSLKTPGSDNRPVIYTIGHSNRDIDALLEALESHQVRRLVDIRHFPRSRHNPQFNQHALQAGLPKREVEYFWLRDLGGYREGGYIPYMLTDDFASGIEKLETLAREAATACMCAERKWQECHRRHVADALADRGWQVVHILDRSHAEVHRLEGSGRRKEGPR